MELPQLFTVAAITIGFFSVVKSLINFLTWVYVMFLRPSKDLIKYGSWALITGSTDGIGQALAFEMASKGLNLVLLGRNPLKLEATMHGIRERYGSQVQIKTIVMDLAEMRGEEIARVVEEEIKGINVGIFVNNAGVAYPYAKDFHDVDMELMESIIKVNVEAATWVSRAVIKGMLKRKRGAIVSIGSGPHVLPSPQPWFALYAASKEYLAVLTRCTSLEYKQHGIDIQCQIPVFVATKMSKLKAFSFVVPSPEIFSKASIRRIGYERLCIPYWVHLLQWLIASSLPDALLNASTLWYVHFTRRRSRSMESRINKMQLQEKALENRR